MIVLHFFVLLKTDLKVKVIYGHLAKKRGTKMMREAQNHIILGILEELVIFNIDNSI